MNGVIRITEEMRDEKLEISLKDGYQFKDENGNVLNATKIVLEKKKKEPTYRPFKNKEECWKEMQKHQPFGWLSYDNKFTNILSVDDVSVALDLDGLDYVNALTRLNFADGTPFGIKEE